MPRARDLDWVRYVNPIERQCYYSATWENVTITMSPVHRSVWRARVVPADGTPTEAKGYLKETLERALRLAEAAHFEADSTYSIREPMLSDFAKLLGVDD